jgi:hypothetical protein
MITEENDPASTGPIPSTVSMSGAADGSGVGEFLVAREATTKFDSWLDRISDFCSSILVKETRQAIKSRQFFLTFMVLLSVVIVWTFFALSPARDGYEVDSLGAFMLCGFLWILGLPLVLIIPYTTYRSLAQEYEDGTIDMVLITTMKPYQIIAGKLGSAMLQVLIYMAVLAPCISFCYLLRGVDISQIYYSIGGGLIVSFGLCCLAIALASAADSNRLVQVISVFLILGLLFCAWMWCFLAWAICFAPMPANQRALVNLMLAGPFLAWISTAIILFFAASAKIAFSSSNRSTMIRVGVTVQVVVFFGWLLAAMAAFGFNKYTFMSGSCFAMQYLLLAGSMMVACHSGMSPRVRRSLPTTVFKRSAYSLYMPGPGRAFLFVVGLAFSLSSIMAIVAIANPLFDVTFDVGNVNGGVNTAFNVVDVQFSLCAVLTNFVYFLFFFCLVFLISRLFAWRSQTRKPFVIEMGICAALLVFLATMASYAIAPNVFWNNLRSGFEISQIFNWYRVQYAAADRNMGEAMVYLLLIGFPTLVMFFFCLKLSAPELAIASVAVPDRVLEEDDELKRERLWGQDADEETIDEIFAAVRPGQDS